MNNETTNTVDAQAIREMMKLASKEQVIEILISTLKNEERLRNELDSLTGTIR